MHLLREQFNDEVVTNVFHFGKPMKYRLLISLFTLFVCFSAEATHLVGGGFSYSHLSGDQYRMRLTIFFDDVNGSPQAMDQSFDCYIFDKESNQLMSTLFMPLVQSNQFVPYTNPPCASTSGVRTRILIYENDFSMSPDEYNNDKGYYVVWERCCRNASVTNIFQPGDAGQTFFMELPSVIHNGLPFLNNSPFFKPIRADYPCVGEPFALQFGAVDPDGDSLHYSLTVPLNGNSTSQVPTNIPPTPGPYSAINWLPGYGVNNAIPGSPPLQVNSQTGLLTCRPSTSGLFVFSVKCEEFRLGRKIGEIRREMQMLVKACVPNTPPKFTLRNPLTGLALGENDTLFFDVKNERVCSYVTARDAQLDQKIRFQVKTLEANVPNSLIRDTTVTFQSGVDSLVIPFCISPCLVTPENQVWKVKFFASDNGCSFSKSDSLTLYIVARFNPDSVKKPTVFTVSPVLDTTSVIQTDFLEIPIRANQTQNANLMVRSSLADADGVQIVADINGIILPSGSGKGLVDTHFYWPEICLIPEKQPIKLTVIVDANYCIQTVSDTLVIFLRILPKELTVGISAGLPVGPQISLKVSKSIEIPIQGTVTDSRLVSLSSFGSLKNLPKFRFPNASGNGKANSAFSFSTDCSTPGGLYSVLFKANSQFCGVNYSDSLAYTIRVIPDLDSLGNIPNLLTANNDDKNDGLSLDKILPQNNCIYTFDFVEIYNRWGNKVFYSIDRNFEWKPGAGQEGVYFYSLHFKERTFSSWLAVVR